MKGWNRTRPRKTRAKRMWAVVLIAALAGVAWWAVGRTISKRTSPPPAPEPAPMASGPLAVSHPKVAVFLPLSGTFQDEGNSLRMGMELAWEELGMEALGAEMAVFDSHVERARLEDAVETLLEDPEVVLLALHVSSKELSEVLPLIETHGVPTVIPANSHENLARHPWLFPLIPSDRREGAAAARYAAKWHRNGPVTVLWDSGAYGRILLEGFQEEAGVLGFAHEILECPPDDPAMKSAVQTVVESDASVVWLAGEPVWGAAVLNALAAASFSGRLLAPHSYAMEFQEDLFGANRRQLNVLRPFWAEDAEGGTLKDFKEAFRGRFWKEPDGLAMLGYDAIHWIGMNLAETPVSRRDLRDRLMSWAGPEKGYRGLCGSFCFGPNGEVDREFRVTVFRGGHWVSADDAEKVRP